MNKDLEQECNDTKSIMDLIIKLNIKQEDALITQRVKFYSYLSDGKDKEYTSKDEKRLKKLFDNGKLEYDECYQFSKCKVDDVDFQTFNFHKEIDHLLKPTFNFEWINDGWTPIAKFDVLLLHFLQMIPYEY